MTNRTEIIRQIEERLGADGSHQMAVAMFFALVDSGFIEFTAKYGYEFTGESFDAGWDAALIDVLAQEAHR